MRFGYATRTLLAATALLALAACDTAEERAEEHFESAVALVEAGDTDRAIVEFRNVFELNPNHVEARLAFASLMQEQGNLASAYSSYLRIVELQPDYIPGRLQLSQMAILSQNWDEARRHGAVVVEAQLETVESRVVDLALRYQEAAQDEDDAALLELTREAEALFQEAPENEIVMRLLVESYAREDRMSDALNVVDAFLELKPLDQRMNSLKLQIVSRLQDVDATEAQLTTMAERFPDNDQIKEALLRFLTQTGKSAEAEAYLRELITEAEGTELLTQRVLSLANYMREREGADAAIVELDAAIASYDDNALYRALKASLLFDTGKRDEGIAMMQAAIDDSGASDQGNRLKVGLARMLLSTGNETGARALVGEVIEADGGNADALKMQSSWLIEDDAAEEAVILLRRVLDQNPDDSQAMMIMATAHARNGDAELARDLLSLAVEASQNGREESLRFARLLITDRSFRPAEDVLIQGLRRTPNDFEMLEELARVYLGLEDFGRASGVEQAFRRMDTDRARTAADNLQVAILARREGREEATNFLEQLASGDNASLTAQINLLRARLSGGDSTGALELAQDMLSEAPDNPSMKLVVANTHLALQNYTEAENIMRDVLDSGLGDDRLWLQLTRVVGAQGRSDDAAAVTDAGLVRFPNSAGLRWAKASRLEALGDIDGAIGIYKDLYTANSNNLIVANNLASLLATYRTDDESLAQAWTVARRLRGTEVPPFQDTYGWIAFRRGDVEEALEYLAPAAERLSTDPIVQFHYATALEAAERPDEALEAFQRVLELADDEDTRPQIAEAGAAITRLEASVAE